MGSVACRGLWDKVRAAVRLRSVAYHWFELVHAPAYVATHAAAMRRDMQFGEQPTRRPTILPHYRFFKNQKLTITEFGEDST